MGNPITTSKTPCRVCGSYKIYSRIKTCCECRRREVVAEMKPKYKPKPLQWLGDLRQMQIPESLKNKEKRVMEGVNYPNMDRIYL